MASLRSLGSAVGGDLFTVGGLCWPASNFPVTGERGLGVEVDDTCLVLSSPTH